MRTIGFLAFGLLVLGACGDPNSVGGPLESTGASTSTPTTSTAFGPSGRLRVTQNQTDCCYSEGQVSFLVVSGPTTIRRKFQSINPIMPVVDVDLEPGLYNVESYQQPCDGNCDLLDPATDTCDQTLDIAEGDHIYLTVAFAPGSGCTITQTTTPLLSPVPDDSCVVVEPDAGSDSP